MVLKYFQELTKIDQILRQKMLSLILPLRKFQELGSCESGNMDYDQILVYMRNMATTHIHTQKSSLRPKLCGLVVLALAVSHTNRTFLYGPGKTQPEYFLLELFQIIFHMLPGGSELCNLHICWALIPQSRISVFFLALCPMNLSWTVERNKGTKYKEIHIAKYLTS